MSQRLFPLLLGADFERLPAPCRRMHSPRAPSTATGVAEVTRGTGLLSRLVGGIARMPPAASSVPIKVRFAPLAPGREVWIREFGSSLFLSRLSRQGDCLREWLFPVELDFRLEGSETGVVWHFQRARLLGFLPLPGPLAPRVIAREWAEDGKYRFHAEVSLPLVGFVVRYTGWLGPPEAGTIKEG